MSDRKAQSRQSALVGLGRVVADAVTFFADADESLADEHQTAREVLSHFVFWHREYVRIVRALAKRQAPRLREGKFREFNAQATREFAFESLPALVKRFDRLQSQLERALRALPDWESNFPIKSSGKYTSVAERVPQIAAHIGNHVARLRRAAKKDPKGFRTPFGSRLIPPAACARLHR